LAGPLNRTIGTFNRFNCDDSFIVHDDTLSNVQLPHLLGNIPTHFNVFPL
jgi:hypothetical protein